MPKRKTYRKRRQLQVINPDAAGIDIGSDCHYVAVPEVRDSKPVRRFGAFTSDLYQIAQWLKKCKITTVAMESTGVYWIPLYQILETKGFEVLLVNARHVKNVPGRKTDVKDS
jgi:transposase